MARLQNSLKCRDRSQLWDFRVLAINPKIRQVAEVQKTKEAEKRRTPKVPRGD
ncbi:MAG: hypothetical protein L0Y72_13550 [Gemmataceae bacterium]|nr:hypothetical protein [Gemmataceae bacterium]MCI0740065.1 hypothetical protein [Gemmataceae bacterium]